MPLTPEHSDSHIAPSSQRNCGYDECGLSRLIPADDHIALIECSLAHTKQVVEENGTPEKIKEVIRIMRMQGLSEERMFGAIICGMLAVGGDAVCKYRIR